MEHLDELRSRLMYAVIALVIGTALCYTFFKPLIGFIKYPLPSDMQGVELTAFGFMQIFAIRFKLAVIGGFVLTSPFIVYQLLAFLTPAMKKNERRYVWIILPFLIILFLAGASFGFFLVLPAAISWLQAQGVGELAFVNKADDYLNFVALFTLAFGVSFETPLVILLLIKLGIVDRKTLRANWRFAYVACFIIGAVATPDWGLVDMLALSAALIVLFELSLFLARWL
jgi:sec-independent protein translocase protein TatC